ncbi:hypothetical protein RhiJN_00383 [Ceratobasidium sp. AG-Ba]|nr:hypothetical protein RhiJN_00383 [Ceratobasidium sp. AG-Ba]
MLRNTLPAIDHDIMRVAALLTALALTGSARAYFSEGWKPGQPVPTLEATPVGNAVPPTPTAAPTPAAKWSWKEFSSKHLDLGRLVTEGPVATALSGLGINAAEQLAQARARAAERGWDEDVPLLTDENYELLVKNETFATPEEAEKRIWFVVVTIGKQDTMSKFVDEAFDTAYRQAIEAGDAPHVKWARIDYLTVTEITTEWMVWKPPTLVVIRKNGNELRFYQPAQIRLKPEMLHQFAATDGWRETEPWTGPWAPGGSRQPYLHQYAVISRKIYSTVTMFPRWVILLVTGGLGSLIISAFHTVDKNKAAKKPVQKKPLTPAEIARKNIAARHNQNQPAATSSAATPNTTEVKKRQGKT